MEKQLPQSALDRIEKEAYRIYGGCSGYDDRIGREAYTEGLTAEATRAIELVEALEKIKALEVRDMFYGISEMKVTAKIALENYNNKTENGKF